MSPSSWRRYRRILIDSIWRDLLLTALFFMIGAAAIVQFWDMPKPKIVPIPTAPHEFKMPKEMLIQYQPVFIEWPEPQDPHAWMLEPTNERWDWLERTMPPRRVLWENLYPSKPKGKK